jgi:hypothetical protein
MQKNKVVLRLSLVLTSIFLVSCGNDPNRLDSSSTPDEVENINSTLIEDELNLLNINEYAGSLFSDSEFENLNPGVEIEDGIIEYVIDALAPQNEEATKKVLWGGTENVIPEYCEEIQFGGLRSFTESPKVKGLIYKSKSVDTDKINRVADGYPVSAIYLLQFTYVFKDKNLSTQYFNAIKNSASLCAEGFKVVYFGGLVGEPSFLLDEHEYYEAENLVLFSSREQGLELNRLQFYILNGLVLTQFNVDFDVKNESVKTLGFGLLNNLLNNHVETISKIQSLSPISYDLSSLTSYKPDLTLYEKPNLN